LSLVLGGAAIGSAGRHVLLEAAHHFQLMQASSDGRHERCEGAFRPDLKWLK
jgi:hypothetical protein